MKMLVAMTIAMMLAACADDDRRAEDRHFEHERHAAAARSMNAEEREACAGLSGPAEMRCLRMFHDRNEMAHREMPRY